MEEIDSRTAEATQIVRNYALGGVGAGLVLLPLVNVALLVGLQLKMLHSLAKLYEVEFSEEAGKALIASLLGGVTSVSLSFNLANAVRTIPLYGLIYGTVSGVIGGSLFGGAATYAIGQVFIQHFEAGGTFLTFDPQQVRNYYAQQFDQGTKLISKEEARKSFAGIKP